MGVVRAKTWERRARGDHPHHQSQHTGGIRTTIDQIAEEDGGPCVRVPVRAVVVRCVAEGVQERRQLVVAAVHVADDVERAVQGRPVRPRGLANDLSVVCGETSTPAMPSGLIRPDPSSDRAENDFQ